MKKRKELDALVTNGKAGKRCGKKGSGSCSAHELLKHDTDTSDMEDFSIFQPRKTRKKEGSSIPFFTICLPLCQFVLVTTCILVSGTLIWLHIGLREDLDILRAHLQKVEAGNKNTPGELHLIHSKLGYLDSNVTTMFLAIKKNIDDIENVTAEIKQLKEATNSLEASIAAAPTIKQLPKDVNSLSARVVTFGSKITALESATKELKDSQSSIQSTTQNLYDELESMKNTLHELSNSTKMNTTEVVSKPQLKPLVRDLTFQSAIQETKQRVFHLQKELISLTRTVDKMNSTFSSEIASFAELPTKLEAMNEAIVWIVNETHSQNARMFSIENYMYYNLSLLNEHMESECCKNLDKPHQYLNISEILELVNKTITKAVVNIVSSDLHSVEKLDGNSSKTLVVDTYNSLMLLAGLLKQFNSVPAEELLTEKNATEIVSQLLNKSFHDVMNEHDTKIKVLEDELSKLSAILMHSNVSKSSSHTVSSVESSKTSLEGITVPPSSSNNHTISSVESSRSSAENDMVPPR